MEHCAPDGSGRIVRLQFLDSNGNPSRSPSGELEQLREYTESGMLKATRWIGNLPEETGGYTEKRTEWLEGDESKQLVVRYVNEQGELTRGKGGYWQESYVYDEEKNLASAVLEGFDSDRVGYVQKKRTYWKGRKERIMTEEYFDEQGDRARVTAGGPFSGYCSVQTTFSDPDGEFVSRVLDGYDATQTGGYSSIEMQFHDGNESRIARRTYRDANGRPVVTKDGYHTETWEYDTNGTLLSGMQLGFDPQVAGYSQQRFTYLNGDTSKVVKWEYLDEGGQPARRKSFGYTGFESAFAADGEIRETVFVGYDPLVAGYAKKRWEYSKGADVVVTYLDAEGTAVRTQIVIKSIMADSTASQIGLQSGDIIVRLDGEALHQAAGFISLVRAGENNPRSLIVLRYDEELEFAFEGTFLGAEVEDRGISVQVPRKLKQEM